MNKIQTITTPTSKKMAVLRLGDYEALIDAATSLAFWRVKRGLRWRP